MCSTTLLLTLAHALGHFPPDSPDNNGGAATTFDFARMREALDFDVYPAFDGGTEGFDAGESSAGIPTGSDGRDAHHRHRDARVHLTLLSPAEPRVALAHHVATADDCASILALASSQYRKQHDGQVGGSSRGSSSAAAGAAGGRRRSQGRRTKVVLVDLERLDADAARGDEGSAALARLLDRVGEITGMGRGAHRMEVQINRYGVGDYFIPHFDVPSSPSCRGGLCVPPTAFASAAAARVVTALVYLDDVPAAAQGETVFPMANLAFRPTRGLAVVFNNTVRQVDKTGECEALLGTTTDVPLGELRAAAECAAPTCLDLCAVHAAMPLLEGTKNVVNVWIGRAAGVEGDAGVGDVGVGGVGDARRPK